MSGMSRFPDQGHDKVMDEQVKSTEIRRRDAGLHESIDVADYHFQKPVPSHRQVDLPIHIGASAGDVRLTYVMRGSAANETPGQPERFLRLRSVPLAIFHFGTFKAHP